MVEASLFEKVKNSFKGGLAYSIYPFFSLLVDFFLTPIFTHMIPPSEFGVLVILNVVKILGTSFFIFGMGPPFVRTYYNYETEKKRRGVIGTSTNLVLICSIILFFLVIPTADFISLFLFDNTKYRFYIQIIILGSVSLILQRLPAHIFRFKNKILIFSIINIVFVVLKVIILIFLVLVAKQGLKGIIIGTFLIEVSFTLVLYLFIIKEISFKFSLSDAKEMVVLGVPLSIQNIEKWLIENSDKLLINFLLSSNEVAVYGIAVGIALIINPLLVKSFTFVWGNDAFAYSEDNNVQDFYSRIFIYYILIGAFLSLGITLTSFDLVKILFPVPYWSSVQIIGFLVVSEVFLGLSNFFAMLIMVKRKMNYILYINTLIGVLNLILNLMFIPQGKIFGAALARFITYITMLLILFVISQRLIPVQYDWKRVLKIGAVFIFLLLIGINISIPNLLVSFLIRGIIASSLPLFLIFIRFYDEEEKRIFKNLLFRLFQNKSHV